MPVIMKVYRWELFRNGVYVDSTDQFVEFEMHETWIAQQRGFILADAVEDADETDEFEFKLVFLRNYHE